MNGLIKALFITKTMKIIETVADLQKAVQQEKNAGKTVGLVPTMGALHAGHLSLVKQCRAANDVCVVSIFVNPTQFNNAGDLAHYPRTLEADCEKLAPQGVDFVFAPSVEEVYPEKDTRQFDFGTLDKVMEGAHRPGHFNGVAQVVSKLFAMVQPHCAYFGEKDYQQLAIIKAMVRDYKMDVEIIACPIVREADGLAMSSRNVRLTEAQRRVAPQIYQTLLQSKAWCGSLPVEDFKQKVVDTINAIPELEVEYFELADSLSLQSTQSWDDEGDKVGFIAVFAGDVRLIDNISY